MLYPGRRFLIVCLAFFGGYAAADDAQTTTRPVMVAQRADTAVTIDGVLDEAVWKKAEAYPLDLSKDKIAGGQEIAEGGEIGRAHV